MGGREGTVADTCDFVLGVSGSPGCQLPLRKRGGIKIATFSLEPAPCAKRMSDLAYKQKGAVPAFPLSVMYVLACSSVFVHHLVNNIVQVDSSFQAKAFTS